MKTLNKISPVSAVMLALLFLLVAGGGQTARAQHLISSKAGFVNRVEGKVNIQRQDSENGEVGRASLGTQMRNGDWLITGADSRAEILLNPGAYLRMDEKAKVRAVNTDLAETRFELSTGSIIVELGTVGKQAPIEIATPQGIVSLAKEGLYRFDAKAAVTSLSVRKGEAVLGPRDQVLAKQAVKVGRGKRVELTGLSTAALQASKLDKNVFDDFDQWSFQRAEMLVAANYSVLRRSQNNSLLAYGWFFDPLYNCYTFIPGSRYLLSPYGFGFYSRFGDCGCSLHYYYPYYGSGPYWGGGGGGGTVVSTTPRAALGSGSIHRDPIHREIPTGRALDSSPYSGGSRSADYTPAYSGGRAIDSGSSAPRGSFGGGESSAPRSSGGGSSGSSGGGGGGGRPSRP